MNIAILGGQLSGKTTLAKLIKKNLAILGTPSFILKIAEPLHSSADFFNNVNGETIKKRKFLQEYGDLLRKHFGEDILIKSFFQKAHSMERMGVLICDDIRTRKELEKFKNNEWFIISIHADAQIINKRAQLLNCPVITKHNTESEIIDLIPQGDLIIDNSDLTMDELEQCVIDFLVHDFFELADTIIKK